MVILLCLLISAATATYTQIHDTCNQVAQYAAAKGPRYNISLETQRFSQVPAEPLGVCGDGPTCCSTAIEGVFRQELEGLFKKINFYKARHIQLLESAQSKIGLYMTQVLTLAASHNARTHALVEEYMTLSKGQVAGIDQMRYPVAVLLDIAQSNGVTELLSENPNCIGEMMHYLVDLGELQLDGLDLARLLYKAIPHGVEVLGEMEDQTLGDSCVGALVRSHRCNLCLDSTNVRPCRGYCLSIAQQCYSHLTATADAWEQYAQLIELVMDRIDYFAGAYQKGLSFTINQIQLKLNDHDTADMCGFNVANNLVRHRRSPQSKIRSALFDGDFLVGMMGDMDEIHCRRFSVDKGRCWDGAAVTYANDTDRSEEVSNDEEITPGLADALSNLAKFNEEFETVERIKIEEISQNMDRYNMVTDPPDFIMSKKGAAYRPLFSLALLAPLSFLLL